MTREKLLVNDKRRKKGSVVSQHVWHLTLTPGRVVLINELKKSNLRTPFVTFQTFRLTSLHNCRCQNGFFFGNDFKIMIVILNLLTALFHSIDVDGLTNIFFFLFLGLFLSLIILGCMFISFYFLINLLFSGNF